MDEDGDNEGEIDAEGDSDALGDNEGLCEADGLIDADGDREGELEEEGSAADTTVATIILEAVTAPVLLVTLTSSTWSSAGMVNAVPPTCWLAPVTVALVMSASGSAVMSTNLEESAALVASWEYL